LQSVTSLNTQSPTDAIVSRHRTKSKVPEDALWPIGTISPEKHLRFVILLFAAALWIALCLSAASVSAHPLGNFTINRYSRLDISAGRLTLRSVVDMAEIHTFQEMSLLDRNRDGQVDDGERAASLRYS
jgi:hypothetical protein